MHEFQFKIKIEDQECENGCDPDRRIIACNCKIHKQWEKGFHAGIKFQKEKPEPEKTEIEKMSNEGLFLNHSIQIWQEAERHVPTNDPVCHYPPPRQYYDTAFSAEILKRMEGK